MDIIQSLLGFIESSGPYVQVSSAFIVGAFVIFMILGFVSETISKSAPGILISLGILFTFIGITYALYNFDPQNITRTIPELLEGLKLAFVSSIAGLITSILYRFITIIVRFIKFGADKISKKSKGELTPEHFYEKIEDMSQSIKEGNNNIKEALVGDGEASLSTQIGKLRNDFRDFAEKVKEEGSQSLIKALEEVIKDFNTKINEQFGENFKKLNEAVQALVIWQKEHKEQVENLTELFKTAQEGIQHANESINGIRESTSQIPEHMESLRAAFDTTNNRIEELYGGLEALAKIKENAEQSIPAIKEHLDNILEEFQKGIEKQRQSINENIEDIQNLQQDTDNLMKNYIQHAGTLIEQHLAGMTEGLENAAKQQNEQINNILEETQNGIEKQRQSINENIEDIQNLQQDTDNLMKNYIQHAGTLIEQHLAGMTEGLENAAKLQNKQINNILEETQNGIEKQQQSINENIEGLRNAAQQQNREMEKALNTMGNNLVPISEKLVETYEQHQQKTSQILDELNRKFRSQQ